MRKKIFVFLVLVFIFFNINSVTAQTPSQIDVILFYGQGCPHCAKLERAINVLKDNKYPQINLITYEIYNNNENQQAFLKYSQIFNFDTDGVPVTIIDDEAFVGEDYSKLNELLEKCSFTACDPWQKINNHDQPIIANSPAIDTKATIVGWFVLIILFVGFLLIIVFKTKQKKSPKNLSNETKK